MKPWEETWKTRWDEDYGAYYVDTGDETDTVCLNERAKTSLIAVDRTPTRWISTKPATGLQPSTQEGCQEPCQEADPGAFS